MSTESAILNNVKKLPESVKEAVLLYTEFLASQYAKKPGAIPAEVTSQMPKLAGSIKGTFVLPLPADFDEPIGDFESV